MPPPDYNEIVKLEESLNLELKSSDEQQSWEKRSIYRVRTGITDLGKAYQPRVVSFGPYHHGKDHLRPMEEHKRRALRHFINRSRKHLVDFFESLSEVAEDIKESYDEPDPVDSSVLPEFLMMMITDGCFMLEILRTTIQGANDYAPNDPIFSELGKLYVLPNIRRDMLLLENQLPMLVLDRLVTLHDGQKEDDYININRLILSFCVPGTDNPIKERCLHVLDVFRKNLVQPTLDKGVSKGSLINAIVGKCLPVLDVFRKKDAGKSEGNEYIIRPATELREHGIRFRKSDTNNLNDISFASGVLRLPMIEVNTDTDSMYLNLIAFERSHIGAGNEVTSYVFFMDKLIDKGQDVALFHTKGIIKNAMESDEAAAKLFNSLAKDVTLNSGSSLHKVINNVRGYCKKRRHKWRANLMHTYFRNPWVIASLIAAVLLFGLTIFQTVYTALGYYK